MFKRALEIDPDLAGRTLWIECRIAATKFCRDKESITRCSRSVCAHEFPEAHFQLGAILSRMGWFERAVQAFEISLRLRPGFLLAHRYLGMVYGRIGRSDLALKHQAEVARLRKLRVPQPVAD